MNQFEKRILRALRRRPTRRQSRRAWKRLGGINDFLSRLYGDCEEIHYASTRKGGFLSLLDGETHFGTRLAYETPLDPGPIDGPRAPYDRGGAEADDEEPGWRRGRARFWLTAVADEGPEA